MAFTKWLAVAALASLPFAAVAQRASQQLQPGDANATVPASVYESAFKNYQAAADEQDSPDKGWRASNDEIQRLGGHAGHMKDSGNSTNPHESKAAAEHQGHNMDNKSKGK
jgi:HAMP domain-containing protein